MTEFVHLHNHTEYSLLDGASRVEELAGIVAEQKSPAVAMTDHGNMFGAVEFFQNVKKHDTKPIIGCEVYVAPGSRHERKNPDHGENAYHMVLLAENETGYRNLTRLVTAGYMEGFYYKPRIDMEILQEHHEGLIALSGCMQGEVAKAITAGDAAEARRKTKWFSELFGDRFFLEIQANGMREQDVINQAKIDLGKELGIGLVATNDNHYLRKDDAFPHDCLLCIGTRKQVEDSDRLKFPNDQFYVKHPDEMWETFKHIPEAIDNTVRIAERCSYEFTFGEFHLPQFAEPGQDLDAMLEEAVQKGMQERFVEFEYQGIHLDTAQKQSYQQRLTYELGVIREMGFAGYFLIVSDFIRWAKDNRIPIGPGRGSAAGSLVSFAIRITDLDPLKYGLLFERFLNPGRKSMPDIDVDICMNRRGEVIDYVSDRYGGEDHVAQISAFGTSKGRQIFKDVGRVFGLTFAETDRITKMMPAPPKPFKLAEIYEEDAELRKAVSDDPRLNDVYKIAQRLEGITRNASVHAAGVVISDRPLVDYVPLYRGDHGETVTQFDMDGVEKIGLIKFDFLGLKTLTAMQITVDLLKQYDGIELDLDAIPEDDEKTFELLQAGRTHGVFQLESDGMRRLLKRLKPESLEEVIAVTALYRPGPMESGMLDDYVERKHGRREITYSLPQLEPILNETYGVIVYQEQVMEIARVLANYSLAEADDLRKAMGKKIADLMAKHRERFADGAVENGIDRKQAVDLYDLIEKFAGYGFNKSHSACYGLIAYRTAYLKAHHPVAFMAALMQCDRDKSEKLVPILREARQMGIEILPPDINKSGVTFTPDNGKIRFGLAAIKGVGEKPVEQILAIRAESGAFESLETCLPSLEPGTVNRKVLEGFIRSGALDNFGHNRHTLHDNLEYILDWTQRRQKEKASGQQNLFATGDEDETQGYDDLTLNPLPAWDPETLAEGERETIGFYLSAHPLQPYLDTLRKFSNTTLAEEDIKRFGDRAQLQFGGVITAMRVQNSPKGRRAFLQVEDMEGLVEVGVFGDRFHDFRELLEVGKPVFIEGDLAVDAEESRRIFAKKIVPIQDIEGKLGKGFHVSLKLDDLSDNVASQLAMAVQRAPGPLPITVHVHNGGELEAVVRLPKAYCVQPSDDLRREIATIFEGQATAYVETAV